MQHALDKAIIVYHNGRAAEMLFANVNIFVSRFPYPTYYKDNFFLSFLSLFPLAVLLIFSLTELTLIRTIVMEKETRLKVNSLSLFHFGPVEQIYAQIWTMSIPLLLMNDYNTIAIYKYRLGIEYIYYVICQLAGVFLLSKFLIWLVILLTIW